MVTDKEKITQAILLIDTAAQLLHVAGVENFEDIDLRLLAVDLDKDYLQTEESDYELEY